MAGNQQDFWKSRPSKLELLYEVSSAEERERMRERASVLTSDHSTEYLLNLFSKGNDKFQQTILKSVNTQLQGSEVDQSVFDTMIAQEMLDFLDIGSVMKVENMNGPLRLHYTGTTDTNFTFTGDRVQEGENNQIMTDLNIAKSF